MILHSPIFKLTVNLSRPKVEVLFYSTYLRCVGDVKAYCPEMQSMGISP